ncbi:FecR domain-containing protein [Paenalcaligenes niemegkensis]|uniref:FecR domain-containing protein n=1 Tax=Paenalcaligenes niemegkensis TaxID=2895469 RepID=UPI001EE8A692|nr:FecR domain-containing protein [Paenalcaligenes niemegkensis]MCQ9615781.1 FecR domain-containing protein [Paenalcaligenes niemegkensis]
MSTHTATYTSTGQTGHLGLNAVFGRFFKPSLLGMLCCVVSFAVASVALAYFASLFQASTSTLKLRSQEQLLTHQVGSASWVQLQPHTHINIVSYDNRKEIHVVNGEAQVSLREDVQLAPVRVYAGNKAVESHSADLSASYNTNKQASIHVENGTVKDLTAQSWWRAWFN